MLLSMTGFGEAHHQDERFAVSVEVRTVNNRHLKLHARISDRYSSLEPDLERLVRESVHRGTVQLTLRVERPRRAEDYQLNLVALSSYRDQLRHLQSGEVNLASLLALPGVVEETRPSADDPRDDWPLLAQVVGEALTRLQAARASEGRVMGAELLALGQGIHDHLDQIAARAPEVVAAYADHLLERVQTLVRDQGVAVEPKDLIREVGLYADRADISEEIVRLRAHLAQFTEIIHEPGGSGRKLEFVVQEMGRETNTIGSKGSDIEISRAVVEIKGALERIRELTLNVE